jgi:transcription initiation factor IIE alpha subunit
MGDPIVERLDGVIERLDLLIALAIPAVGPEADSLGKVERAVLDLCDMRNTTDQIANRTGKNKHHVEVALSQLRKKGLVTTVRSGAGVVHARVAVRR